MDQKYGKKLELFCIRQKIMTVMSCFSLNLGFHSNFYKEILFRISWKYNTRFGCC